MLIKILGSGCAKCNRLEQLTRDAVAELGVEASLNRPGFRRGSEV